MKAIDLLVGFNSVKDSYVISAEEFRQGKQKAQVKRLSTRKVWLIAAVIALTLLLVGCAIVYVLSLQNLALGEEHREYYDGSSETVTILSVQGVKGTSGYQASKEWREWLHTYDPDDTIYHSEEAFSEDFGDEYYAYNLYTRDMKDKLDEICTKYNLKLLGKVYIDPDVEAACRSLQIQGILRPGVQAETHFGGMRYYAGGSFSVEGTMTLTAPDTPWPYEEIISFDCYRKDSFSDITASIGPEGSYEEWTYTTSNGVDVLIVMQQRNENLGHTDTYMKTWEIIPPQRPAYFYAFIASICRHLSFHKVDWKQAAKRNAEVVTLTEEMELCIPDTSRDREMEAKEIGKALNAFLESLPKETRLIFLRRYWHVDTIAEIAARYGITESKVKMQLSRTRAKLCTYLEKEGIRV